ncbi:MAG TPA: ArgE/DapE family deacylase [Armatimonadota bacterium]|jgi:acetylornithine deacetylase
MSAPTCDQIASAVAARSDEGQRWLTKMIEFPSVQGNEKACMRYIREVLSYLRFPSEVREIPDSLMQDPEYSHAETECSYAGRSNLVSRIEGTGGGRSVIIQSHADVIPPGDWAEAFTPRLDGDFIYGRGASDAKGQIVTALLALSALKDLGVRLAGDVQLQVVIEEEVGGNGALALIRQGCKADGVIVMEASGGNVYPANRGALWFRLKTFGVGAHMGRRHEAVNAIEKMMEAIRRLLVLEQELIASSRNYPLFERYEAPVQLCLGMINGGAWPSMVPDECTLEGGVGFLPNTNMTRVKEQLVAAIESSDDEWLKSHYELTYPKLHNDAYEIDPTHPLVTSLHQAALDCGHASEVFGWNVSCDARLYAKVAGLPTVVFGPSDIREAHSSSEKIAWSEVLAAAETLAQGLIRWCGVA